MLGDGRRCDWNALIPPTHPTLPPHPTHQHAHPPHPIHTHFPRPKHTHPPTRASSIPTFEVVQRLVPSVQLVCCVVPDLDGPVVGAGGQQPAAGTPLDAVDLVLVALGQRSEGRACALRQFLIEEDEMEGSLDAVDLVLVALRVGGVWAGGAWGGGGGVVCFQGCWNGARQRVVGG